MHCQGVGCTPWRPLGLCLFCMAGVGQCPLPRGRMYALASLGSPPLLRGRPGTMCAANVHCQGPRGRMYALASLGSPPLLLAGVGQCALPRGRMYALASLGSPPPLRGRRGTMSIVTGSWRFLGLRLLCVAGVGQCALPRDRMYAQGPRGRMYALASLGSPPLLRGRRGTMCTAKGQGVGCTPWRPLGLCFFCVAGVAQCALPRDRMYSLASLGSPPLLRGRRGTMCTAKGSDVRPGVPWVSASFAWQAWDNVHCHGVGCTPWRPLGLQFFCLAGVAQYALTRGRLYALASPGSPILLRGRRGTMCTAKESDVRPGVPWVSASFAWQAWDNVHCQGVGCTPWRPLGLRLFCVAGVGQCALQRAKGSDVRPGVPWVSASFAWQLWDNVHCQGIGCTPWRPLGLRLFCMAGVGQCALLVAFAWQACDTVLTLIHTQSFTFTFFESLTHSLKSLMHSLTFSHSLTPSLPPSLTHSLTHSITHSLTPSLLHSLTHSITPSLAHSLTLPHSLTPSLTHHSPTHPLTHSHSPTHPLTHSPTHPLTHSPTHPLTHSPTHPLTHSPTHPLTHPPTHPLTHPLTHSPTHPLTHSPTHPLTHSPTHPLTHSPTHPLTHSPTHPPTHPLTHSPTHSLTHSLTHFTHSHIPQSHTPHSHHSLTLPLTHLYMHIHTHTHKLTHHHPSITLILPLPFLLFYAQSKSEKLVTCGVIRSYNSIIIFF